MNLGLSCNMSLRQTLLCSICGQEYDSERSSETILSALLFGHAKYSVCPMCLQQVIGPPWSKSYMRKWEKRVEEIRNREIAEMAEKLFRRRWHTISILVRKDKKSLCYWCDKPETQRALVNIWGDVYDVGACDYCYEKIMVK